MTKYQRGGHIKCKVTMSTDPTDLTLKIYDSLNELQSTVEKASLTHPSTGVYTYNYLIPANGALGDWKYEYTAETSAISIETKYFTVDLFDSLLYCTTSSVYRKAGIESTVVDEDDVADYIIEAMAEIDSLYQRSFGNAQTKTEWFDIEDLDENEAITELYLGYRPVQSITSVIAYDKTDTLSVTYTTENYWLDKGIGRIRLKTKEFTHQNHRVKVIYTYGYTTVPVNIKNLAATICAMRILLQQMGGTYDDVTSYTLPSGVSIGVGEPYMNMTRAIEKLEKEKNGLLKNIGQLRTTVLVI